MDGSTLLGCDCGYENLKPGTTPWSKNTSSTGGVRSIGGRLLNDSDLNNSSLGTASGTPGTRRGPYIWSTRHHYGQSTISAEPLVETLDGTGGLRLPSVELNEYSSEGPTHRDPRHTDGSLLAPSEPENLPQDDCPDPTESNQGSPKPPPSKLRRVASKIARAGRRRRPASPISTEFLWDGESIGSVSCKQALPHQSKRTGGPLIWVGAL
ncbi:hypothetical protein IAT40_003070 [Kwoniella sp. CBS 6097]